MLLRLMPCDAAELAAALALLRRSLRSLARCSTCRVTPQNGNPIRLDLSPHLCMHVPHCTRTGADTSHACIHMHRREGGAGGTCLLDALLALHIQGAIFCAR
jgi:hypothetical protein